ncbi:general transcription factor IIH subunit 2 isoform X2 [Diabrotica undecimpunctata]|uniref:general transcription factor IIH subunit 2 isoform X2 n=1 Tax=Diabrotica undecimpunctata TaxID=50387 RepID=UPI003B633F57
MGDDEDGKEYRWETGYEKTWEAIKEDDEGFLQASVADIVQRAKRKRQALKHGSQKLGMMRHLFLLLDCSEAMASQDLKPTRLICTLKLLEIFLEEFFDQNPISQLGIILMQNKRAERISELAGNCRKHIKMLSNLNRTSLQGEPSLQNGLEMALSSLKLLPSHASREILVIMGSLTTCDPGDITKSIEQVDPPPAALCLESSLIKMGFPHQLNNEGSDEPLTMCMCHVDSIEDGSKLTTGGYYCPQCFSKYCELPVECRACGLTLVSAPHLARSYHHLFPAANYIEVDFANQATICAACQRSFGETDKQVYSCPNCKRIFCIDCDIFVHETLHTCPGCATNPLKFQIALTN